MWLSLTSVWCVGAYLKKSKQESQAVPCRSTRTGDDGCNSLFYGTTPASEGRGYVCDRLVEQQVVDNMTTIHSEYRLLPKQLYRDVVSMLPTVCVDVICQRDVDKKILLFLRKDKPAAGVWWWPGGRMFKGETFFATAARKLRDETGNPSIEILSQEIVSVWNTFFPDSSWDTDRLPDRDGCQTVNITVFCRISDADLRVASGGSSAWAVEGHRWVTVEDALKPENFDKYVQANVQLLVDRCLI